MFIITASVLASSSGIESVPNMESPIGPNVMIDGRPYLYFAGTGHLSLQSDPAVIQAAVESVVKFGLHTATSRVGFGNTPLHFEVERLAARLLGQPEAIYLVSGYMSTAAMLTPLHGRFDIALVDECSHRSTLDALALADCPLIKFAHLDAGQLADRLYDAVRHGARPLVITDGVFPATGEMAPIEDYRRVMSECHGAILCVDDAHALGVLGANGRGTLEHFGEDPGAVNCLIPENDDGRLRLFSCATLSKAVGGHGGVVAGQGDFIGAIRRFSPNYRGASGAAVPVAGATAMALRIYLNSPQLRSRLHENTQRLKGGLRQLGLEVNESPVPFVGLRIGDAARMQHIQQSLMDRRIVIGHIRDYSGAGPEGILRIAVFATHTAEMINALLAALSELL